MDRYSYTGNQAVENAYSAKDQKQLDAWKASQVSAVKQYVPVDFEHYAVQHINKQYQHRLNELQNEANQQTHAANAAVQQTLLWRQVPTRTRQSISQRLTCDRGQMK